MGVSGFNNWELVGDHVCANDRKNYSDLWCLAPPLQLGITIRYN